MNVIMKFGGTSVADAEAMMRVINIVRGQMARFPHHTLPVVVVSAMSKVTDLLLDSLRRALLALPELYREVVVLCDLEEMTYADAAAVLECSAGTIASRLHRAHNILRARLVAIGGRTTQDRR